MSKAELLEEFAKLTPAERNELWDALWTLEERQLVGAEASSSEENTILDAEFDDFQKNPQVGKPWSEVEAQLRNSV